MSKNYPFAIQSRNVSNTLREYERKYGDVPPELSLDQLYRICRISKQKARFLVQSGFIPARDTGRKTWRYVIARADVIAYLERLQAEPNLLAPYAGCFSSHSASGAPPAQPAVDAERFANWLTLVWQTQPDAMDVPLICELTGYFRTTVTGWARDGKVRFVDYYGNYLFAKCDFIPFFADTATKTIPVWSEQHQKLVNVFLNK